MSNEVNCWAIIPAAGIGERIGSDTPKQYIQIADKTILEHALTPFINHGKIKGVVVALNASDTYFSKLNINTNKEIVTVNGGETRTHSVLNALLGLKNKIDTNDFVLVHDAARPCLGEHDLNKLIDATMLQDVGCILAAPVADTVKQVDGDIIVKTVDRSKLWRAYTPQMFRYGLLLDALNNCINNNISVTDEASAIEVMGLRPAVLEGDASNIKVTTPDDLEIAKFYLSNK